jgi:glycosyltransferase involved in cell wall biosynthesis
VSDVPLASILIPCRNAAPWLAGCLDSAFAQTWPRCEVILVDDGSSDESPAIARSYTERGLRIFPGPARNAAAARNTALRHASGDWIQFLDADDLLAPDKIGQQLQPANTRHGTRLLSGSWARFQDNPAEARFESLPIDRDLTGVEYLQLHWETGAMRQPGAWLAHRSLLDHIGPWDEMLTLNDDGEYFARAALAAATIVHCPAARSFYRSGHGPSLSGRKDAAACDSLFRSIESATRHLLAADSSPRSLHAAAHAWKRVAFELYPAAPGLSRRAEACSAGLGGSRLPYPAGPTFQILSRLLGWRTAKRLRNLLSS